MIEQAVILAGGLGTRIKQSTDGISFEREEIAAISSGIKGMVYGGDKRPISDSSIQELIDAGIKHIIFVVNRAGKDIISKYYEPKLKNLVDVSFAVQENPLGTANAVLAAENYTKDFPFIVLCFDNVYGVRAIEKAMIGCGENWCAIGYDRRCLENKKISNLSQEKVKQGAVMQTDDNNNLVKIVEAAGESQDSYASPDGSVLISLGLFGFDKRIYEACKRIAPIQRKKNKPAEYELPSAVQFGIDHLGVKVHVHYHFGGFIDLTSQADVNAARALTEQRRFSF